MLSEKELIDGQRWLACWEKVTSKPMTARETFFARAIEATACAERDARIAELERELKKEKQYVKEMTKDRDHWMTVAAERALFLDKNRKVNKPLSEYEFDEIG